MFVTESCSTLGRVNLLPVIRLGCLVLSACLMDGSGTLFDRPVRSSGLTAFGKYSYGIYVYHSFVLELMLHLFRHHAR
jgi:peptidoglycan/LPS O-acetylase OafA/YrhL